MCVIVPSGATNPLSHFCTSLAQLRNYSSLPCPSNPQVVFSSSPDLSVLAAAPGVVALLLDFPAQDCKHHNADVFKCLWFQISATGFFFLTFGYFFSFFFNWWGLVVVECLLCIHCALNLAPSITHRKPMFSHAEILVSWFITSSCLLSPIAFIKQLRGWGRGWVGCDKDTLFTSMK